MSDESRIEKQLKKMKAVLTGSAEAIETEEPQSRIEKLLEEINGNIGKSSGEGVKPDWSVDDENADGYIANKPAIRSGYTRNSILEGRAKSSSGNSSHAEGFATEALGQAAHAEGTNTVAQGTSSHTEGDHTYASTGGDYAHVEGLYTTASSEYSHVFGKYNAIDTEKKYVEIVGNGKDRDWDKRSNARTLDWSGNEWLAGKLTVGVDPTEDMDVATKKYVDGKASSAGAAPDWSADENADGFIANKPALKSGTGENSILEGTAKEANGPGCHAEGNGTVASFKGAHAEGNNTTAFMPGAHAEGNNTSATGHGSHAEGSNTLAQGSESHAEGEGSYATSAGTGAHAEGLYTTAASKYSHVFGKYNAIDTENKFVEIVGNGKDKAQDKRSNARTLDWSGNEWLAGKLTVGTDPTDDMDVATKKYVDGKATGAGAAPDWSAEEGAAGFIANKPAIKAGTGSNSIIQNQGSEANGNNSHAEGFNSHALGKGAHAEGMETIAQAVYSHAEGYNTKASGYCSHSEGRCTIAGSEYSHVIGKYNVEDKNNFFVEIVGNGTGTMESTRSNARTLDWSGNEKLAGKLTVGAAPSEDMDVTTKKYVDDLIAELQKKIDALTPAAQETS